MTAGARPVVRVLGATPRIPDGLSPLDRGFMLGDAIFETIRIYGGVPFRLRAHLDRMSNSAAHFGMQLPADLEESVTELLDEHVAREGGDHRLRITLSRGVGDEPGVAPGASSSPTCVLALAEITAAGVERAGVEGGGAAGLTAVIAESRRNERAASAGHKTVAYMDAIVELGRAAKRGANECIFLDTQGHVSEASASNIFLHDGDALITPALSCGALPGITRAVVLELARGMSMRCEERVVEREELVLAREIFLTNSVREVTPVLRLVGEPYVGARGEAAALIAAAYRELVAEECGKGRGAPAVGT